MTNILEQLPDDCFHYSFVQFLDSCGCLPNLSLVSLNLRRKCQRITVFQTEYILSTDIGKIRSIFPFVKKIYGPRLMLKYDEEMIELLKNSSLPQFFTIIVQNDTESIMVDEHWKCPSILNLCALDRKGKRNYLFFSVSEDIVDPSILELFKPILRYSNERYWYSGDWLRSNGDIRSLCLIKGKLQTLDKASVVIHSELIEQVHFPWSPQFPDPEAFYSLKEEAIIKRETKEKGNTIFELDSVPIQCLNIESFPNGSEKEIHIKSPVHKIQFETRIVRTVWNTQDPWNCGNCELIPSVITVFLYNQNSAFGAESPTVCFESFDNYNPFLLVVTDSPLNICSFNQQKIRVCTHADFARNGTFILQDIRRSLTEFLE